MTDTSMTKRFMQNIPVSSLFPLHTESEELFPVALTQDY